MELKVETLDPCRRKMKIAIPAESVDREIELAYGRIARSAQVAGFRQGKAPRKILELHYGPRLRDEVKEKLVDESFAAALKEKGIEPAIPPSLDVKGLNISPGEPFRYEVEVEVWPELHVSGYSGIKAMRKKVAVSDEEVERSIAALLDQHAEFIPVEGRPLLRAISRCWISPGPSAAPSSTGARGYGSRWRRRRIFPDSAAPLPA
jgi:trigger factor